MSCCITHDQNIAVDDSTPEKAILFALTKDGNGILGTICNGLYFAVADVDPNAPTEDYTRTVLVMLSILVNYAAQSESVSSSAPVRLLPIP